MTDGPYKLPSDWKWLKLGEVCQIIMGQSPSSLTYNNHGQGLPFFQGKADFGELYPEPRVWCSSPQKLGEPGDVLISVRAPVGPTNLAKELCCIGRGLAALRPSDDLERIWLLYYLRSVANELEGLGKGTAFAAITKSQLEEIPIPTPPLADQHRIMARMEALMKRVLEAKLLREHASRDIIPLLQSALAEELRELRSAYPSHAIGQLKLKGDLEIYGGGTPSKKSKAFWEGSIPWVSPKDMKRWLINGTEDHISPEAIEASSAKMIPAGAVLAVVRGMILARSWPIAIAGLDLTINQDMKALVPKAGILSEYVGYVLKGLEQQVLGQVETAAHGTRRLRTSTLESLEVPVPPLADQRRIVTYLDSVQAQTIALKRAQEDTDAELRRLEQAILDRAFRGEL